MSKHFDLHKDDPNVDGWDNHDGTECPYFRDPVTGEKRFLTYHPTPRDHPMLRLVPSWTEAGNPIIPESDYQEFDETRSDVEILDQNGAGACNAHAWVTAMMMSRSMQGAPHVSLSAWFLYTLIDGGRDAGSNPGDAMATLIKTGVCPFSDVPYGTIRPAGYNSTATANAGRYKLKEAYRLNTPAELLSAVQMRYAVCCDVRAGSFFNTDSNETVAFSRGWTNHEIFIGERMRKLNGQWQAGMRNSWNTTWGNKGRGFLTPSHFAAAGEPYAIKVAIVHGDEPGMPPKVA